MIDFHSHILPAMDDGSRNEEESLEMLKLLKKQGISRVVATPHFYANNESVSEFISRRSESYQNLSKYLSEELPDIILGTEIRYYEGISRMENLGELCIQGSQLLLLEMPSDRWSRYTVRELLNLSSRGKLTLVLAHIERYLKFQPPDVFESLLGSGVMMQVNASFINDFFTRHKALSLLKNQEVHFIGSDCHNLDHRPPDIKKAFDIISKKLGKDFLEYLINYGNEMFL